MPVDLAEIRRRLVDLVDDCDIEGTHMMCADGEKLRAILADWPEEPSGSPAAPCASPSPPAEPGCG